MKFKTHYIFDDIESVLNALFSSHEWKFQANTAVTLDILTSPPSEHTS